MSTSRSEILRRKKAETEVEKLPSVKVLESVSYRDISSSDVLNLIYKKNISEIIAKSNEHL